MFLAADIGAQRGAGDDFWYAPVPGRPGSAIGPGADAALRLSTVYKCVRVRAETLGMLPLMLYRRLASGGKARASDHWAYSLLHDKPNPWMTSMQWRMAVQSSIDLRGNGYSEIVFDGAGRPDMLVPHHPDTVTVESAGGGEPRYRLRDPKTGRERTLLWGEMLHVTGHTLDGYVGLNPIEMQREAISAGIHARKHGANFFANGARVPFYVAYDGRFADQDKKRDWAAKFHAGYSGANAGRIPVMEKGFDLKSIGINNADAEFMDFMKWTDIDICGTYRMPPHKIGLLDRATWGNIEHQQIDFVTDCVMPSAVGWEQAITRDLLGGDESVFAEFKLAGLLRGDTKSRYEAYGKGIQDGWLLRSEAREAESFNPVPGLDQPLEPLNMAPAGSRRAAQERGQAPGASLSAERQALLLAATAERAARKECALWRKGGPVGADHARWLADVMALPETVAAARVDALAAVFAAADPAQDDADFVAARAAELIRLGE